MPFDEKAAERVRRALESRDVLERKMMGGLCFMLDGYMCCGVMGSSLIVRVGRDAYERTLEHPHVKPMELAGRRPSGYVLVEPSGFRTAAALATWVATGVDFVATLEPRTPGKAKSRRRKAS